MQRWKFSRKFKIEAVKLVRERGVSVAQVGPGPGGSRERAAQMGEGVRLGPHAGLSGHGQMKPEQQEIERQRRICWLNLKSFGPKFSDRSAAIEISYA